jgi:periplasmic divalent cation tolerance protein
VNVLVLVTCPDRKCAEKIADALLDKRLAACVNIVPGITSKYRWKGRKEESTEVLLLIKSREGLVRDISRAVKDDHPYDIPEVIALPVKSGLGEYLRWIDSETK